VRARRAPDGATRLADPELERRPTISRDRSSGAAPPKLCQRPREPSGSFSPTGAGSATISELAEPFGMSLTGLQRSE
jgi:hypothetical protein